MKQGEGLSYEKVMEIEPESKFFGSCAEIRVGVKKVSLTDSRKQTSISFQRGISHLGRPDFQIMTKGTKIIHDVCSMGHSHETSRKDTEFGWITLSWEHAEQLMEWFKEGNWIEVRERRKRGRGKNER